MQDHSTLPLFSWQPETKEIPLTQGKVAVVDATDFDWLSQFKWYAHKDKDGYTFYAERHGPLLNGKRATITMHALLAGKGADHIDGDGLNNTCHNLRPATHQQNCFNKRIRKDNTSGYKGVVWHSQHNRWQARIKFDGSTKHLGYFATAEEAALAYNKSARELYGEFALANDFNVVIAG